MKPEDNFYNKLRHYLNLEYDERNKKRITDMLQEYLNETPKRVIIKKVQVSRQYINRSQSLGLYEERLQLLLEKVAKDHGFSPEEVKRSEHDGRRGPTRLAAVRADFCIAAMLLFKELSSVSVARFIGYDEHSTVLYWMRKKHLVEKIFSNLNEYQNATSIKSVA